MKPPRLLAGVIAGILAATAIPSSSAAQVTATATTSPSTKDEALQTTAAFAALGAATWGASRLATNSCRWCDRTSSGADTLNGFDRNLRKALVASGGGADRADTIGTITEVTTWVVPMVQVAASKNDAWKNHERWESVRMVTWAMAANTMATGVLKRAFARERPFVHFNNPDVRSKAEPNASFPSGHTSSSFTSVFAAASACQRLSCGHDKSIWLVGVPLASVTGVLRIRADKHYATDVLGGFAIGAAIGWFIPQLYDAIANDETSAPAPQRKSRLTWGFSRSWVW